MLEVDTCWENGSRILRSLVHEGSLNPKLQNKLNPKPKKTLTLLGFRVADGVEDGGAQ